MIRTDVSWHLLDYDLIHEHWEVSRMFLTDEQLCDLEGHSLVVDTFD